MSNGLNRVDTAAVLHAEIHACSPTPSFPNSEPKTDGLLKLKTCGVTACIRNIKVMENNLGAWDTINIPLYPSSLRQPRSIVSLYLTCLSMLQLPQLLTPGAVLEENI